MKEEFETNFIRDMRRKILAYQEEKFKRKEENNKKSVFFQQETQAKDDLLKCEDSEVFAEHEINKETKLDILTGWTTTRNCQENHNQMKKRSYSLRKNCDSERISIERNISERRRKNLHFSTDLKKVLKRLESPKRPEKVLKTESVDFQNRKTLFPCLKTEPDIRPSICSERRFAELFPKNRNLKNSENSPSTLHEARSTYQYQRINRKPPTSVYAQLSCEQSILQQLIKNVRGVQNVVGIKKNTNNLCQKIIC